MVKTVCVDMYKPYINLINKKFPNAVIIYDAYQIILNDFQNANINGLRTHLKMLINQVSPQMKTAFKTLIENFEYVKM